MTRKELKLDGAEIAVLDPYQDALDDARKLYCDLHRKYKKLEQSYELRILEAEDKLADAIDRVIKARGEDTTRGWVYDESENTLTEKY